MAFRASWQLRDRPRRIALLLDDCQEEYRPFAAEILPNLVRLTEAFRGARGNCPIVWSSWSRRWEDGICNAMDRWYGPKGLSLDNQLPKRLLHCRRGRGSGAPSRRLRRRKPNSKDGWFYHSHQHLDMFWSFTADGQSYWDEKLKQRGVDTVVIAGLWTDECILAAALAGLSRGYVRRGRRRRRRGDRRADGPGRHEQSVSSCRPTAIVDYLRGDDALFAVGAPGAVKGVRHPDGRKDD